MKAMVERFGDRIWLRTSAPTPGLGNRIKGASWRKDHAVWTFPLRLDVCRMLREEFGAGLKIRSELDAWARKAKAKEATLTELGSALGAVQLTRVAERWPAMAAALTARPYQSRATRFVAEGRNVLLADTPGLGKTLEAVSGILETGVPGPYLIVTPKTALVTWQREIERWAPDQDTYVVTGSHAKRAKQIIEGTTFSNGWIIINPEMLRTVSWWVCPACDRRWRASDKPKAVVVDCGHESKRVRTVHEHQYPELFAQTWGAVVMDESHNSLVRLSGTPTQVRNGARLLQVHPEGCRIAASGTPMRGKAHLLWGTLNWLRPTEFTGFWSWAESYFTVTPTSVFGGQTIGDLRPERSAMLDKSLSGIMLRRTKAEVSPELPPKQYMGSPLDPRDASSPVAVWLPMEPEQQRVYREMQRTGISQVKGGEISAVGALAEITRMKQFASAYARVTKSGKLKPAMPSNKFDWLLQFMTELGITDGSNKTSKVVVVSQFTSLLRCFAVGLMDAGIEVCGITGAVSGNERQRVIDTFNAPGGPQVMFLQVKSGGVAITLDSADDMVFLDETHNPDDQTQAEDRINNRRPEEKVATRRYWYLKSQGSVEEAIAAINAQSDMKQGQLLDGRRGVAYAKAVFDYLEEAA